MCALGQYEVQMSVFNSPPAFNALTGNILLNIHVHTVVVSQSLGMGGFDDFQGKTWPHNHDVKEYT